jgi:hypothetical protein
LVGGKRGRGRLGEGGHLHVPSQRTTAPSLSAARGREERSALAPGSGVGRGVERSEVSEWPGALFIARDGSGGYGGQRARPMRERGQTSLG